MRFVSSPSFINFFCHLFILVWSCGYLFYTLGYNPILALFLLLKLFRFCHWSLFQFLWNFEIPINTYLCVLNTLFTFCNCKMLQIHVEYFLPSLRITNDKEPWVLYWRMAETKILLLGVLIATGLFLGPSQLIEPKNWCAYSNEYIHKSINISIWNHLYLY